MSIICLRTFLFLVLFTWLFQLFFSFMCITQWFRDKWKFEFIVIAWFLAGKLSPLSSNWMILIYGAIALVLLFLYSSITKLYFGAIKTQFKPKSIFIDLNRIDWCRAVSMNSPTHTEAKPLLLKTWYDS